MRLKDFDFNSINVKGLSIFVGEKEVVSGYVGEVLRQVAHLSSHKIKSTNIYFDTFVIRLEEEV